MLKYRKRQDQSRTESRYETPGKLPKEFGVYPQEWRIMEGVKVRER